MEALEAQGYVVTPGRGGRPLHDLWRARGLLVGFALRDLQVRYRQAALGAAWAVLQPLALMVATTLVFHGLLGVDVPGVPYAAFAFAGLVPWTFFQSAVSGGVPTLVNEAPLLRRLWFPREALPLSAVLAHLVDLAAGFALLLVLLPVVGLPIRPAALLALLWIPPLAAFTAALAMLLSAVNVRWRDVKHALPLLLQVFFFVTPVVWPPSVLPAAWRTAMRANPLAAAIEGWRAAVLEGAPFDGGAWLLATGVATVLLVLAYGAFKAADPRFADVV